jgi:hypothetical protein
MEKVTSFKIISMQIISGSGIEKVASNMIVGGYDPKFLYVKVRAVSAGEYWGPNKNGDYFPEQELKESYKTFLTNAKVFKNHENKKSEQAIGEILEGFWNDRMKYVELYIRIDRVLEPKLCRNIETGVVTDVSMGCRVKYSLCSVCGNKATNPSEFCIHVSKKGGLRNRIMPNGKRAFEINVKPKFHDISIVLSGAAPTEKIQEHIAEEKDGSLIKVASAQQELADYTKEELLKMKDQVQEVLASYDTKDESVSEFVKLASQRNILYKEADIDKKIRGLITSIGTMNILEDSLGSEENEPAIKLIKLLYTPYWDKNICFSFAQSITELAQLLKKNISSVFEMFLHIANFLGIELSPLELDNILTYLTSQKNISSDIQDKKHYILSQAIKKLHKMEDVLNFDKKIDDNISKTKSLDPSIDLFQMYSNVHENIKTIKEQFRGLPAMDTVLKISLLLPAKKDVIQGEGIKAKLLSLLAPYISQRSMFMPHIINRAAHIIRDNIEPNYSNLVQFSLPYFADKDIDDAGISIPAAMNNIAYSAYQKKQIRDLIGDDFSKFAATHQDVIFGEKIAALSPKDKVGVGRRLLFATPLLFVHKTRVEDKLSRGEDVNPVSKTLAKYPLIGVAIAMDPVTGGSAANIINKGIKGVLKGRHVLKKNLGTAFEAMGQTLKKAEIDIEELEYFYKYSLGENFSESIDSEDLEKFAVKAFSDLDISESKYNDMRKNLKLVIASGISFEDFQQEKLAAEYLKTAALHMQNKLIKQAGDLKEILLDTTIDLSYPFKSRTGISTVAGRGPGSIVDAILFNKLMKAINKKHI